MKKLTSRRNFLYETAAFTGLMPVLSSFPIVNENYERNSSTLRLHVFSKHLQFLTYDDMAKMAGDIGFDGVELTVRKGGHVQPENVVADLPIAVDAIKKAGLEYKMMVTGITELNTQSTLVLETAAKLGIEYYRLGYYRYPKDGSMVEAMDHFKAKITELAQFNKKLKIQGGYQNHAGTLVGASMWEVWQLLENTGSDVMGSQYDIRHAMVEGGVSWSNGLRLIRNRINSIVLKDYKWEKINGKWELVNTPLGEGMVDFLSYFKLLKEYNIQVPVAMHFEYDLDGAEHGDRNLNAKSRQKVYDAMKKDLDVAQRMWKEA